MQRDMDLVRALLLEVEESASYKPSSYVVTGIDDEVVSYHIKLMHEAGLIEGVDVSSADGLVWWAIGLTWAGHEFLDAARSEKSWLKTKEIGEKVGGLTFEMAKVVLSEFAKQSLKSLIGTV